MLSAPPCNRDAPDLLADVTPGPHDYVSFAQLQSFTTDARGGNHRAYGKRVEPAPQSERQRAAPQVVGRARARRAQYPRGFGNSMPRLLAARPGRAARGAPVALDAGARRAILRALFIGAQLLRRADHAPQGRDYVDFDKLQSFVSTKGGNKFRQTGLSAGPLRSRSADHLLSTSASRASLGDLSLRRVCEAS